MCGGRGGECKINILDGVPDAPQQFLNETVLTTCSGIQGPAHSSAFPDCAGSESPPPRPEEYLSEYLCVRSVCVCRGEGGMEREGNVNQLK